MRHACGSGRAARAASLSNPLLVRLANRQKVHEEEPERERNRGHQERDGAQDPDRLRDAPIRAANAAGASGSEQLKRARRHASCPQRCVQESRGASSTRTSEAGMTT